MKKQLAIISLLLLSSLNSKAQWTDIEIGPAPIAESYDIEIGDGRNDGIQRIYVSSKKGGVYEWTHDSGNWTTKKIHDSNVSLETIALGDARNDGKKRLYFTQFVKGGKAFEAEWTGSDWKTTQIESNIQSLCVFTGPGRNDGKNYLYIGSTGGLNEYAWNGTSWDKTFMFFLGMEGVGFVGEGKNDNVQRVYSNDNFMQEYTWNGSDYSIDSLEQATNWPDASFIAEGRNDGIQRIYANTNKGRLEYTYSAGNWIVQTIDPTVHRGDFVGAAVKADGKVRLYTTFSQYFKGNAGPMKEYEWDGSKWNSTVVLDTKSGATAMIKQGMARNDDTMRLYAPYYVNGTIHELTWAEPWVDTSSSVSVPRIYDPSSEVRWSISPNPSADGVIKIKVDNVFTESIEVQITTMDGRILVSKYLQDIVPEKEHEINIEDIANGLYLVKLQNRGLSVSKQIHINR